MTVNNLGQKIDYGTSTITLDDSLIYLANTTITAGTGTVTFNNAATVKTAGFALPSIVFSGNGTITGTSTINRMQLNSGSTYTFDNTATYTISSYTSGDWDGGILVSNSPGTQWSLVAPSGVITSNVNVTDSDNSGGVAITALLTAGNVDGGNNANWVFTASGTQMQPSKVTRRQYQRRKYFSDAYQTGAFQQ